MVLLFVAVLFVIMARVNQGSGEAFILLAVVSGLMIYWVRELKKMSRFEDAKELPKQVDQKNWVYDLIKNNDEMVFVAEVPGPEDQINVRLNSGMLNIKGGQNFSKEIPLDLTTDMGISDYKYRNGVLTIRIHKIVQ